MSLRLINRGNFEKIFTSGHPGIVSHLGVLSVTVSDGSFEWHTYTHFMLAERQ